MKRIVLIGLVLAVFGNAKAQTPFEVFAGNKKASVDVLFFKWFKNHNEKNTPWLLFNRSRGVMDYEQTTTQNLPQMGIVNSISYNLPQLKGVAPVINATILNRGVLGRAGVQFYKRKNAITLFTWLVYDIVDNEVVDFYVLTRYEPKLTEKWSIFSQLELINAFSVEANGGNAHVQRIRLGLKRNLWQFGLGADNSQINNSDFFMNNNAGIFIRHEF
jgi:hypothetical protein